VRLNINHVLGSRLEPAFSERLLRLQNRNAVDVVQLSDDDLEQQRLQATTRHGRDLAITLPWYQRLFNGAVLGLMMCTPSWFVPQVDAGFGLSRAR